MSDELLNEFIYDSRDHLSTAGAQLLELEKTPDSLTALNALMGTMHTIKGNSGFLDLKNLYTLLHHAESLLQTVREKHCACPPKMIDLLLQVLDTVEALLDRLEGGDDDNVEWLGALNQALSEFEANFERSAADLPPAPSPPVTQGEEAEAPRLNPAPAPKVVIKDDLKGKINLLSLKDGLLAEEEEVFAARIEAMFAAGLKGLVMDLKALSSLSNRELKTLIAVGRKHPESTAFLVDARDQENLYRVFKVLRLDSFLRFFQDNEEALAFIKK